MPDPEAQIREMVTKEFEKLTNENTSGWSGPPRFKHSRLTHVGAARETRNCRLLPAGSLCSLLLARVTQRWACWQVAKIWRNRFIESKRLFLFQNKCNQLFLFRSLFSLILGSGRKKSEVVGSGWECSEVTTFSTIIDLCRGLIMMANPFGNPGTAVWPACFFRS